MKIIITEAQLSLLKESINPITDLILKYRPSFMVEWGAPSFQEVNNGGCEDFADLIFNKFPKITVLDDGVFWIDDWGEESWNEDGFKEYGYPPVNLNKITNFKIIGHVWIYYDNKHYDVECPNGVSNAWELPIFQRNLKKYLKE